MIQAPIQSLRDQRPWTALDALRPELIKLARRRGCSREDAQDLASETLLRTATFSDLDHERIGAFATSVMLRLLVDQRRREATHLRALPRIADPSVAHSHEQDVCDRLDAGVALMMLQQMPPTERSVLVARADGLSVAAVSAQLHLSPKTIEGAYTRARVRLRRILTTTGALLGASWAHHVRKAVPATVLAPIAMVTLLQLAPSPLTRDAEAASVPTVAGTAASLPQLERPVPGARRAPSTRTAVHPGQHPAASSRREPSWGAAAGPATSVVTSPTVESYNEDESVLASAIRCLAGGLRVDPTTVGCGPEDQDRR